MKAILASTIFCAIGAILCWIAAGKSLGLMIGSIGFATLIVPQFAMIQARRINALLVIIASSMSIAIVWMIALHEFASGLILFTYLAAICGTGWGFLRIGMNQTLAAAVVIVIGFAWMSWPMWWSGNQMLVALNPIFNLNACVVNLGIWTQQPMMYRLTMLGQDVPFALPRSIWPCTLGHAVIGALLVIPRRRKIGDELSDQ